MLVYLNGLLLGLSLVMALGPQNIFLIKQGARRNHAILSAVICFFCDLLLVCGSVAGLHKLLLTYPKLQIVMIGLGSTFLLYYAVKALMSVFATQKKNENKLPNPHNRKQIILFALGFSLLNPHAIVDSLVIIGSGSRRFPGSEPLFVLGVTTASLIWFCSLTFTTHYFANILGKKKVWQGIEFFSGILMAFIGIKLAAGAF